MIFTVTDKISAVLKKILHVVLFVIMAAMLLTVLLQVFSRFVFDLGVSWTEEVARTFFVYMIFIGIALVEQEGSQVRLTLFIDKLPKIPRFILDTFILICEFAFLVFVLIGAFQVWDTATQITYVAFPNLSYRILYIPLFVGMPLTMWFLLMQELELIRKNFLKDKYPRECDNIKAEE